MSAQWKPEPTNTHQDHVIAHVRGTTALAYFHADSAVHFLLDIGFIWTIYVDGEMGLLPQTVVVSELSGSGTEKGALSDEINSVLEAGRGARTLAALAPVECLIEDVEFFTDGNGRRRIVLRGEGASLAVETYLTSGRILVEPITDGGQD